MYELKITGTTFDELVSGVANLANQFSASKAADKAEAKAEAKAEPKVEAKPSPKEISTPKEETDSSDVVEISYAKDVGPRVLKLAEAKGRPAAVAVLTSFGVEKAPQLKASQYAAFIKAIDAAMED